MHSAADIEIRQEGKKGELRSRSLIPSSAMEGALAILVFLLMMIGTTLVMSARLALDSPYQLFTRQILSTAIALTVMLVVSRIDYHFWVGKRILLWGIGLAGLFLLMVPHVGVTLNGARRWIHLGFMTLQPSELARVILVILMASLLSRERLEQGIPEERPFSLRPPKALGFGLLMLPYLAIILHEPDFGSDVFIVIVIGAMLFLSGVSMKQLGTLVLALMVAASVFLFHHAYAIARFHNFSQTQKPASLLGTQLGQSLVAIGSGGLWGQGLGHDWIGGGILPEPGTDFIFALVGEELGFFWAVSVVLLFGGIFYLGMRTAARSPDFLGRILVQGLTLSVVLEAMMNLGVVTGLFPTKGIPLPFMSFGGSSLLANAWGIGIILSVSRFQRRLEDPSAEKNTDG